MARKDDCEAQEKNDASVRERRDICRATLDGAQAAPPQHAVGGARRAGWPGDGEKNGHSRGSDYPPFHSESDVMTALYERTRWLSLFGRKFKGAE